MNVASKMQEFIDKYEMGYKVEPITTETLKEWKRQLIEEIKTVRRESYQEGRDAQDDEADDWEYS